MSDERKTKWEETGYTALGAAIILQAIEDYNDLNEKGVDSIDLYYDGYPDDVYSKEEIERFFESRWCSDILQYIKSGYTGKEILSTIR